MAIGTFQVLSGCCPDISVFHWAVHTWQLVSLSTSEREPERESKTKARVFCTLILEMTSHYFCHIVFFRNESLGPDHTQKERITKRYEYSEARIIAGHFRGCLLKHHQLSIYLSSSKAKVFLLLSFLWLCPFPLSTNISFSPLTTYVFHIL